MNSPQLFTRRRRTQDDVHAVSKLGEDSGTSVNGKAPERAMQMFDRSGWAMPICAAAFGLGKSIGCPSSGRQR